MAAVRAFAFEALVFRWVGGPLLLAGPYVITHTHDLRVHARKVFTHNVYPVRPSTSITRTTRAIVIYWWILTSRMPLGSKNGKVAKNDTRHGSRSGVSVSENE